MAVWWDERIKRYRYQFKLEGRRYTGSAERKADAEAARVDHKRRVREELKSPAKSDTDFRTVAYTYLDWSEKRHAKKTYEYKRMVCREFYRYTGDIDLLSITPQILHEYLNTRPSNHNYNVHRKELCALFSFAIHQLKIMSHSPCWGLDKMPEHKTGKKITCPPGP